MEEINQVNDPHDFAMKYFDKNGYRVIGIERKRTKTTILAKNLKTGSNQTFEISGGELRKLVHSKNDKYHPWRWEKVARCVSRKSYIEEMREAVNGRV